MRKFKIKPRPTTPVSGLTLKLKTTDRYISPHCHALYLGEDETGRKVLLPTFSDGFSIVDLDSIDEEAYEVSGKFNIDKEILDGKTPVMYEYKFFDTLDSESFRSLKVTVEKLEGLWTITEPYDEPSWAA